MMPSLKKLRGLAVPKHEKKGSKNQQFLSIDELAKATQDMNDMRDCYDKILSAAAATANSVYELSESLGEMGDCLLEKTALNDDEESGKVLLMLGKVQFELQKLVDGYRGHIFQTITVPSESLLNELRIVEEMKKRCDEKRELCEELKGHNEKVRSKGSKIDSASSNQLQVALSDFDEEINMFVFRMKSLKQGQSRSLLTQAARHHAAQLTFFKKALTSLEAIEPHVRLVAERNHIDYQFSGLEDDLGGDIDDYDETDEVEGTEDSSETHDDVELNFDYKQNDSVPEGSNLKNSMELDNMDAASPADAKFGVAKENLKRSPGGIPFSFRRDVKTISKSAPLFPEKKLDPAPSHKFTSYVLPTPVEAKSSDGKSDTEAPQIRRIRPNLWHSSPLGQNKYEKPVHDEKFSGPVILDTNQVLRESNNNAKGWRLPPLLSDGLSSRQFDPSAVTDARKVKRQAFSGPLTGKPWPNRSNFSASGPIGSSGYPPTFSGSLIRSPFPRPTSTPKSSSRFSSFVSSPQISELHELPRPPAHLASGRPPHLITHSGPLVSRVRELSGPNISNISGAASTLPMPPQTISRSYSIPSRGQIEIELRVPLEASQHPKMTEDISSPTLTPISLPSIQPASPTS